MKRIPPALAALLIQAFAFVLIMAIASPLIEHFGANLSLFSLALLQGTTAAALSAIIQERWWIPIHFIFMPAAVAAAGIPSQWFLLGFLLLFLVYRNAFRTRVPLYLSNRETARKVLELLPDKDFRFADLGSGLGDMLHFLAREQSGGSFYGVESAPLPYLVSKLRCRKLANCEIMWGDFEKLDISTFDFVYVFLSPEPMPALWQKAKKEMKPGSLLISNSFPVPGAEADEIFAAGGKTLYLWKI